MPGVATIEQQRAGALRAQLVDQGLQVGEAANLAVDPGGFGEVEVGECVGFGAAGLDAKVFQQALTDQVGRLAERGADAKVDVGFAEPDGQQLGVTVGEMQQRDVSVARHVVEIGGQFAARQDGFAVQCHAGRGGDSEHLQKLAAVHVHGIFLRSGREGCGYCRVTIPSRK